MHGNTDFYGCHSDKRLRLLQLISSSKKEQAVPTLGGSAIKRLNAFEDECLLSLPDFFPLAVTPFSFYFLFLAGSFQAPLPSL